MSNKSPTTKGNKIVVNSIVLILSKVSASISVIVLFIILSRHFSPSDYGSFRQLWLINKGLIAEVFSLGIPLTLFYFLPQLNSEKQKSFFLRTVFILSFLGILAAGLITIFSPSIAHLFNNPELEFILRLFCLFPLFSLPTLAVDGTLISIGKVFSLAVFTIVDRLLLFILSVIALIAWKTLIAFCITLVFYSFLRFIISMTLVFYYYRKYRFKAPKITILSQFKIGFPTGLSNIVGLINVEIDKIIISSFFNVSRFAVYANGAFEIPFLGTVSSSISSVLMPEFVNLRQNNDIHGLISLWHKSIHKVALVFIPLMVFFFVIARDFITFMFSETYADSTVIFQFYLVGILANMTWYGTVLVSIGHSREPFFASLIGLIFNVTLNYLFIFSIGFTGPAIASVITNYIVAMYYLFKIKTYTDFSWKNIYPWKKVFQVLSISIFSAATIIPLTIYDFIQLKVLRIIFCGMIYFITAFAVFYLFKQIDNTDIKLIKQFAQNSTGRFFKIKS